MFDYLIFFSFIQQKIAQKRKKNTILVHDLINDFLWINLFNEFICYVLNQSLEIPFCGRNFDFQWFPSLRRTSYLLLAIYIISSFFPKVKQCSKWERRQQHIMHAVFAKAGKTLFPLIIFLDLIVLTYNLSSLISAIDYANTSMSVWKMLHVVMPLSYIYIVEKSHFVSV